MCGTLIFRAATAALVEAAMKELQAEYDASPAGRLQALYRTRKTLSDALYDLVEAVRDDIRQAIEHAKESGRYINPTNRQPEIKIARQKLADFDINHPEVIAEIEARYKAVTYAVMWE